MFDTQGFQNKLMLNAIRTVLNLVSSSYLQCLDVKYNFAPSEIILQNLGMKCDTEASFGLIYMKSFFLYTLVYDD